MLGQCLIKGLHHGLWHRNAVSSMKAWQIPEKNPALQLICALKLCNRLLQDSVIFTSSTQATYAITGCFYLSKYNATAITIDLTNVAIVGIYEKV